MHAAIWFAQDIAKQKAQERAKAAGMTAVLRKYGCSNKADLVAKGKRGELDTYHAIANWDTLAWEPSELGRKREAIPLGVSTFDVNYDYPKRRGPERYAKVFLFVVPPTIDDPNVYSLHCQITSAPAYVAG